MNLVASFDNYKEVQGDRKKYASTKQTQKVKNKTLVVGKNLIECSKPVALE
jgi:hypothetical protein